MKKFMFPAAFCGALLGLTGSCQDNPVTPPTPTPVVTGSDMCDDADVHLAQLCSADPVKNSYCCEVDAKTKKGKTYTQFCIDTQNDGISLNPTCVAKVTSCDQIDVCTNSK